MDNSAFVGTWRLVSWENRDSEGRVTYPFGQDALGYVLYTADGYTSVAIMKAHRTPFAGRDMLQAEVEERAAAAASYITYSGRYELRDDKIVHHVELSLFPNWIGGEQERFYEFDGNRLTLSTRPMLLANREQRAYLVWERAVPPA